MATTTRDFHASVLKVRTVGGRKVRVQLAAMPLHAHAWCSSKRT